MGPYTTLEIFVIATTLAFLVLCTATTGLRIYGRYKLDPRFKPDDFTALLALAFYLACSVETCMVISSASHARHQEMIINVLYTMSEIFAKLTLGLFFRKHFQAELLKLVGVYIASIALFVMGFIYLAATLVAYHTDSLSAAISAQPTISVQAYLGVSIVWALLNALTALAFTGMTICGVLHSALGKTIKVTMLTLGVFFGLGCAASWITLCFYLAPSASITNMIFVGGMSNREAGLCLALSSCNTVFRLYQYLRRGSVEEMTNTTKTLDLPHVEIMQGHLYDPEKQIRRLTTITISNESRPNPRHSLYSGASMHESVFSRPGTLRRPSSSVLPHLDFTARI